MLTGEENILEYAHLSGLTVKVHTAGVLTQSGIHTPALTTVQVGVTETSRDAVSAQVC